MKKLFTLCFLIVITFTVKAQQPSFEETIKSINDFLVDNPTYFDRGTATSYTTNFMRAKKDGTVTFLYKGTEDSVVGSFNLHDIISYEFVDNIYGNGYLKLHLSKAKLSFGNGFTEQSAKRLEKMLKHLSTLCTEKDPFGN